MKTISEIGWDGEKLVRDYLTKNKIHYMQIDMLAKIKGNWYSIEAKRQEAFQPPPFLGHGLPLWQVNARIELEKETGIIALFMVIDKDTNILYCQRMTKLLAGEQYQTNGNKPRIIFPLTSYKKLEDLPWQLNE